ncbi:MAG: hypothetical protein AB7V42_14150 [Thermoleophilia bacterium]
MPRRRAILPVCAVALVAAAAAPAAAQRPGEALAPLVSVGEPGSVTTITAVVNGTVDPRGRATTVRLEVGRTPAYGTTVPLAAPLMGDAPQAVSIPIPLVEAGVTYHYRLVATSDGGETASADHALSTPPLPLRIGALGVRPATISARRGTPARIALLTTAPASVRVAFQRRARGRWLFRALLTRPLGPAGAVAIPFRGRVGGRPLAPGRYRVVAVARTAAGERSYPVTTEVRITG